MAPQQKRSQQYDWFKGPAAKGGPKDRKSQAKKVWKFTKIFIYLALFVFSMTGCIQSLILKTTNYVGTGVEFYANRDEVAPHVSKIDITKVTETKAAGTTTATPDIYTLATPATNLWLNKDIKGDADHATLHQVHTAVSTQSSTHPNKSLRLEDAFKGSNEAIWISPASDSAKAEFKGVSIDTLTKTPFVLSSLADTTTFTKMADSNLLSKFATYEEVKGSTPGQVKPGTLGGDIKSFDSTTKYREAKRDTLNKIVGGTPVTTGDMTSMLAAAKTAANKDAGKLSSIKSIENTWRTNLARQEYSLAVLTEVLKDTQLTDWLKDPLTTGPLAATGIPTDEQKLSIAAQQKFLFGDSSNPGILGMFNLQYIDGTDHTKGLTFAEGKYPFFSGSTNWRPLVTWGDAWGEGPFYGLFVYPTAYISANMIAAFPGGMAGWETLITIFVVVFSMRFLAFLLSFKATMQQTRMQELAAKKAIIDAKYAPYKGNKQMENRQRQEVSEMYKKQGVSPFGSMTSIFITMPLFLAIWRTIGALPHIKSTVWLGINFSATSWRELFHGSFQYLPLMILAAGFAAFQQILPRLLTKRRDRTRINVQQKAAMKKGNKTQNIMMLVFVFMSLIFSAGLQVYWIAGGVWMTIQSTLTHFLIIRQSKNKKRNRIKT